MANIFRVYKDSQVTADRIRAELDRIEQEGKSDD